MAPLPSNQTARYVVKYATERGSYTTLIRVATAVVQGDAITFIEGFLNNLMPQCDQSWISTGGDYYPTNSNFSFPFEFSAPVTGDGVNFITGSVPEGYQLQVLGRDNLGRRFSHYWSGMRYVTNQKMRIARVQSSVADTIFDAYDLFLGQGLVTITNSTPVLKPYINIVINDYLTAQGRQ